jgi:hypothetical protein
MSPANRTDTFPISLSSFCKFPVVLQVDADRLCGLVARGPGSILSAITFSEK